MIKVLVEAGQTIMDVAIQEYGSAAGFVTLCQDNNLEFDDELDPGNAVLIRSDLPNTADVNIVDLYRLRGIQVNTGGDQPAPEVLLQQNGDPITQQNGGLIKI